MTVSNKENGVHSPMSARLIMALAALAGFFLIISGLTFMLWQESLSSTTDSTVPTAAILLYAISVCLSTVLLLPVILMLSIRLYSKRPNSAIIAGTFLGLGCILDTVATLASLGRTIAMPKDAQGDPLGNELFQSLTIQYLAVDSGAVGLVYVAAIIYAIDLWRLHRVASSLLLTSTGMIMIGFLISPLSPSLSSITAAGSIVVYGLAYIALGHVAVYLGQDQECKRA